MAKLPPPKKPKTSAPQKRSNAPRAAKTFSIKPWAGENEGEKIILYGQSGGGKTTLASMLPGAVFIGIDDGGRKIRHPKTGKPIQAIAGVETFEDVRDAINQKGLVGKGQTLVVDTLTKLESLAEPYIFSTIKTDKGQTVTSLEGYGWGKGFKHSLDTIRLILTDLEALVRTGVNVCLISQESSVTVSNPEGLDFLQDGPKLHHNRQHSTRLEVCEWADHVLRIGLYDLTVSGSVGDKIGKVQGGETRAVYTAGAAHFYAKSRTIREPIVSFEEPEDDSIWKLIFGDSDE